MSTAHDIAKRLDAGEPVLLPTETVWGLAARAGDARGVGAIYRLKGRSDAKPLAVCVASRAQAAALAEVNSAAEALMDAHWPGPLTLVLPVRAGAPIQPQCTDGGRTVALRCPAVEWRETLCAEPLALTSANVSGERAVESEAQAAQLFPQVARLSDPDPDTRGEPTTIVRVEGESLAVLRQGGLRL